MFMNLWNKYLGEHEKENIREIGFRSKEYGWHSWSLRFRYKDGSVRDDHNKNMFYKFFFSNLCLNEACYHCNFKAMKSDADIRVGDFWGKKYADNLAGVSSCVALTESGQYMLKKMESVCTMVPAAEEDVLEVQMLKSPPMHKMRKAVMKALKGKRSLKAIYNTTLFPYRASGILRQLIRR